MNRKTYQVARQVAQVCAHWWPRAGSTLWLIHLHVVWLRSNTLQQLPQVQGDVGGAGALVGCGQVGCVVNVGHVPQGRPEGVFEAVDQVAAGAVETQQQTAAGILMTLY